MRIKLTYLWVVGLAICASCSSSIAPQHAAAPDIPDSIMRIAITVDSLPMRYVHEHAYADYGTRSGYEDFDSSFVSPTFKLLLKHRLRRTTNQDTVEVTFDSMERSDGGLHLLQCTFKYLLRGGLLEYGRLELNHYGDCNCYLDSYMLALQEATLVHPDPNSVQIILRDSTLHHLQGFTKHWSTGEQHSGHSDYHKFWERWDGTKGNTGRVTITID